MTDSKVRFGNFVNQIMLKKITKSRTMMTTTQKSCSITPIRYPIFKCCIRTVDKCVALTEI